jgi:integrin beta 2
MAQLEVTADGRVTCDTLHVYLAYSTYTRIEFVQLNATLQTALGHAPRQPIVDARNLRHAVALAQNYEHALLYYADRQSGSIFALSTVDTGTDAPVRLLKETQNVLIESLAFDFHNNDLYFTTSEALKRATLSPNGSAIDHMATIIRADSTTRPLAVAVDPCRLRLFWTNVSPILSSQIETSLLSGHRRRALVSTRGAGAVALTVDVGAPAVYWADADGTIERCDYDGERRVTITKSLPRHAFAIVFYDQHLYVSDWVLRGIVRVAVDNGQVNVLTNGTTRAQPMGVAVIGPVTHSCTHERVCVAAGCANDDCTVHLNGRVICGQDQSLLPVTPCTTAEFTCVSNGHCIPFELTCDGVSECTYGEDESQVLCAQTRQCPDAYFACGNALCVPASARCNGVNDCLNLADERGDCMCDHIQMMNKSVADWFQCVDGMCIPASKRCDMHTDCTDASDEIDCAAQVDCTSIRLKQRPMIACAHTNQCVLAEWMCDGNNDCSDGWDELNCATYGRGDDVRTTTSSDSTMCPSNAFMCASHTLIGQSVGSIDLSNLRCIPTSWQCDGHDDCTDGSDELACPSECAADEFVCESSKHCIRMTYVCDGQDDCGDNSDETLDICDTVSKICNMRTQYTCANATRQPYCIGRQWICDGAIDCEHGDDEAQCVTQCGKDEFMCTADTRCIRADMYCDGVVDCDDASDEPQDDTVDCKTNRALRNCTSTQYACDNLCLQHYRLCDGRHDCEDGSDESEVGAG